MEAKIQSSDIKIERLEKEDLHYIKNFSCGNEQLDAFFIQDVIKCIDSHYVVAYCAKLKNDNNISYEKKQKIIGSGIDIIDVICIASSRQYSE